MGAFDMLRIANSSLGMHQTWLDALSNNIANVNTVRPMNQSAFQAQMVVAQSIPEGGVAVAGVTQTSNQGRIVYSPDHPLADASGYVRTPDTDMGSQMSQLIMAQRGFQASVQTTKTAQDTYQSALQIGAR